VGQTHKNKISGRGKKKKTSTYYDANYPGYYGLKRKLYK